MESLDDLVMIPCKSNDRSTIRIERLTQKDVDYQTAHFVAEGPFKGIIINKAVTKLKIVGNPDLTLSFDVSMSNANAKVQSKHGKLEYRERRNVYFWFKPEAEDGTTGREYMKQLLKPEGFPRDYVSFTKKALVLTQRFPLIQRIDIVLIPQYSFDEQDSGYFNGDGHVTSPTHEDWLKTTQGEEGALVRERASGLGAGAPGSASMRAGQERLRKEQEQNQQLIKEQEERQRKLQLLHEKEREEELMKQTQAEKIAKFKELEKNKHESEDEDMEEAIANYITVMTPAVYDYQYLPEVPVTNKTFSSFRLKAKGNAHVALSSVYGDTERKTYEVVIGGHNNTKSVIRDGGDGPVMVEAVTLNILDGDDFKPFWISWDNGQVVVGEGTQKGEDPFLIWDVPQNRIHSVNCMAVSTAPGSEGQWEFIEYIYPRKPEDETRDARRARFKTSLMWLAKKQKMLQVLEDAYPNSINTPDLLRICNIGLHDMMTAVIILKEFEKKGLITEVIKGVWIRSPGNQPGDSHVVKVVDHLPTLKGRENPTIAIVTSLYCEKLAVDAMMEHKISYVKYKTEVRVSEYRESHVYTMGRIGNHQCVVTKLSRVGGGRGATIAAGNTVTRLLGIFDKVEHVILVGCAGAVPNYHDFKKHVRLGDIVVSCPAKSKNPIYIHCEKFEQKNNKYDFKTKTFVARDDTLQMCVSQMRQLTDTGSFGQSSPWEKFIEQGLKTLNAEESNFSKPAIKKDKLFAWINDERVQVEHPKPPKGQEILYKEGQTHIRYGPLGSGKYLSRNEKLRLEFANKWSVMAMDSEVDACLEAIAGSRKDSFIIIRGIADYQDGTKSKEWQPYASLVAAAYMKALVTAMPSSYGRSGFYR